MKMISLLSGKIKRAEQGKAYDRYHKVLYYTSLRIVNNSFDAEEVMHDTLLRYFDRSNQFGNETEALRWMKRVCINLSIDIVRKRTKERARLENWDNQPSEYDEEKSEELEFNGITVWMIKDALSQLADGYRIVLSLFLFEGYDYEEISSILGINQVSVRSQYIRGKASLLKTLGIKEK